MLDLDHLPPRLKCSEASEYLLRRHGIRRTPGTLGKYRVVGGGPEFERDGVWPLYRPEFLDTWAEKRLTAILGARHDQT